MSRRLTPPGPLLTVVLLIVAALLASSCSRTVTLGPEEAVEVMVLDGVGRGHAECIVASLNGQLDLAKITGLEVELTDAELTLLATTSGRCAPTIAGTTGIMTGGEALDQAYDEQQAALSNGDIDVEDVVFEMVSDGLEADIGDCLVLELSALVEPGQVLGDIVELSRLIADCRNDVGGAVTETSR